MRPSHTMSDWVVYHKVEERGWPEKRLEVFWHKNVSIPMGARVWLIAGEKAKPRYRYYLSEWFVVDKTGRECGKNVASGTLGKHLEGMHRLDQEAWFAGFRNEKGNFKFGISPITDAAVVRSLEKIAGLP